MTNSAAPTALRVQPGSNGRFYVLDGHKVIATFRNIMLAVDFAAGIDAASARCLCTGIRSAPSIDCSLHTPVPAPPTQVTVRDILPGEDEGNYAEYVLAMHEIADDMGVAVVRVAA